MMPDAHPAGRPRNHINLAAAAALVAVSAIAAVLIFSTPAQASFNFIASWGSPGAAAGQFNSPEDLAADPAGNVYVADTFNDRIQVFDFCHRFLHEWGGAGAGNGQLSTPLGIASGPQDDIYVADTNNDRIQVFDPAGTFLRKWGRFGKGNGQFNSPRSLTIDSLGNVYVVDTGNSRIQVFNTVGTFVRKWGSLGAGIEQFHFAVGVGTDTEGNVYVAESGPNNRIQMFGEPQPTIAAVREAIEALGLPHGIENRLVAKLRAAQNALDREQAPTARNNLGALAAELEAQRGKKLGDDAAAELLAEIEAVDRSLSCLG